MMTMTNFARMFTFLTLTCRLRIAVVAVLLSTGLSALAQSDSTVRRPNIVERIIGYFGKANKPIEDTRFHVSVIGGPFYSADTKLGIGIVAAGLYKVDSITPISNVSLKGQVSTSLFYSIGLSGDHIFHEDRMRIGYSADFRSFPTYFWGIGYDQAVDDERKAKYTNVNMRLEGDLKFQVMRGLYIGPTVGFSFIRASKIDNPALWYGLPRQTTTFGIGATVQYDTRDAISEPHRGWYIRANQIFYPRALGNTTHSYTVTSGRICHYHEAWRGAVIAGCINGEFTYGATPWTMLPTFGGSSTMRGYYNGQYRDKCAMDASVELRQHIYGRSGAVVWVGAGTVFPDFNSIRWKHVLPNAGVGYRWEFKQRVNVRVDVGFGRDTWGVEFNINEAF